MTTALQVGVTKAEGAWISALRATIRLGHRFEQEEDRPWVARHFERGFLYLILLQGMQVALMEN